MLFIFFTICVVMILAGVVRYTIKKGRITAVINKYEFRLIGHTLSAIGGVCIAITYGSDMFRYLHSASLVAIIFATFGVSLATIFCMSLFVLPAVGEVVSNARLKYLKKKLKKSKKRHPRH